MKILVLGFMLLNLWAESQTIEKFSIDSGGASISNGTIQVLFTIGEVSVQEVSIGSLVISEGFVNPILDGPTLTVNSEHLENTVSIFPNPTSEMVYVKSDQLVTKIKLYSLKGQLLFEEDNINRMKCDQFEAGIYLLHVLFDKQLIIKRLIIN